MSILVRMVVAWSMVLALWALCLPPRYYSIVKGGYRHYIQNIVILPV